MDASIEPMTPAAPRATVLTSRLLGPDLARGGMLLLIALANVHVFAYGFLPGFRGYPTAQPNLDRVVTMVQMVLVDGRAFPLFAALFGYGLVQLTQRRSAQAAPDGSIVRLLRRRGWWLVLIGVAHALLLFTADIVALYGLTAVAVAGLVVRSTDRRLLLVAGLLALPALAFGALRGLSASSLGLTDFVTATPVIFDGSAVSSLGTRLVEWAAGTLRVIGLAPAVLLGAWAARRRVLEGRVDHRRALRYVAVLGAVAGAAGGVPSALMAAGIWTDPPTAAALGAGLLHLAGGYAVAAAYVAMFALAANRIRGRGGLFVEGLTAAGQRSLTLYLAQSAAFLVVLHPAGFGLGNEMPLWLGFLIAVGVWLTGTAVGWAMGRLGIRGPAEVLLRRMTYGQRSRRAG